MTITAASTPLPLFAPRTVTIIALVLLTLAVRLPALGDPNYHMDEQFYLLFGEAITQGAVPYIDVWDRKPIGLFLLYAGFALFGDGLLAYQIGAMAAAGGTAILVALIVKRRTGWPVAAAAGLVYLLCLEVFMGGGGQSPVFYNLPVVGAAVLLIRASERDGPITGQHLAMLLCGLAVAIKPTAVFEGAGLAFGFLWLMQRRGVPAIGLLKTVASMVAIGAVSSLLGIAAAFAWGAGPAYLHAVFVSIFERTGEGALGWAQAAKMFALISPLLIPALAFAAFGKARMLVTLWLGGALLGFVAVPNFFVHYTLPLFPPMIVAAFWVLPRERTRIVYAAFLIAVTTLIFGWPSAGPHDRARVTTAALARTVSAHLNGGCLWVHDGPISLYRETGACTVTPYLFPEHLNFARERFALGRPAGEAAAAALAAQPAVIVTRPEPLVSAPNRKTAAMLEAALAADYRRVAVLPERSVEWERDVEIWARR
ncbi:MAG: hypothetical protein V2J26_10695 [Pacificimonas sp.]|jgi:4-amino-4-deoxy-L-arabinose transferase-like glycosyltransferase|nr:hypothetical protein [Pacificimonas sp.]